MYVTVVILTKNEEKHIGRCLASVQAFANHCLVVDCGSQDRTVEIAKAMGAEVLYNPWVNHAVQLNWGIARVPQQTDWVMRVDADEVVQPDLAKEVIEDLGALPASTHGVYVSRRNTFLGRPLRYGGLFPVRMLRIFRRGKGRCEMRWMDEHLVVDGDTADFSGELIDDNLNSLSWWTEKHNGYASREVVDILNREYRFQSFETMANLRSRQQASTKRWIKENVYTRLPVGGRALLYFLYRYCLRLGFLDGREGAAFHTLQAFWYRYLVDTKLFEVKSYMRRTGKDVVTAIRDVLDIDIDTPAPDRLKVSLPASAPRRPPRPEMQVQRPQAQDVAVPPLR